MRKNNPSRHGGRPKPGRKPRPQTQPEPKSAGNETEIYLGSRWMVQLGPIFAALLDPKLGPIAIKALSLAFHTTHTAVTDGCACWCCDREWRSGIHPALLLFVEPVGLDRGDQAIVA